MPNFKPKNSKKLQLKKNKITLDDTHKEKMAEFKNIKINIIPINKIKIENLKKEFYQTNNIERKLQIKSEIKKIKKDINENKIKEENYLLENSKYIFNYFEKKKKLSEGYDNKKKILHRFFDKNYTEDENVIEEETNKNLNTYLKNVDTSFLDIENYKKIYDICNKCSGELIPIENKGVLVCKVCSLQTSFLIEHEKPSYKEPPKEVCFYAYKRINHFREILAQFQAKETTQIPEQVLIDIKNQIKKERINLRTMSNKKAKDILKKLGYNKFYEHIPFIKDKLGIKPPVMRQELEEKLCNLFLDIQKPYSKHCPNERVNFLNYYYVLYKMCELLDERKFLPFFPMLKDPMKRIEQDEIWKKICKELQWEFISTI
tara:strand:+ start:4192 stop:5313 length:1122 start_codon:yes stop_codon:yes gene_type:complete